MQLSLVKVLCASKSFGQFGGRRFEDGKIAELEGRNGAKKVDDGMNARERNEIKELIEGAACPKATRRCFL